MSHPIKFILFTTILVITSCATLTSDIDVETHSDPGFHYKEYKTYAWADSAQIAFDPVGQWEQPTLNTDDEVRYIINRELSARNINLGETDPDLLITFAAGIDTAVLGLKEQPDSDTDIIPIVPKAALVIALIDARTGYTLWLGYATANAQEQQSIENIRARIDFAISAIFKTL